MKNLENFGDFFSKAINKSFNIYKSRYYECRKEFSEKIVHDIRVSIRRFLSLNQLIIQIIDSEYSNDLKLLFKQQLKDLNFLRDTQVQIIFVRRLLAKYPILERFLATLLYFENDTVNSVYRKLSKFDFEEIEGLAIFYKFDIKNKIYDKDFIKNRILLTIENYYQNISELITRIDKNNPDTIHQLRLSFKKFRYTLETLEPLINVDKHEFKVLHSFQTVMGKIQDNCVIYRNLNSYIDNQLIIPKAKFRPVIEEIFRQRELLISSFLNRINIVPNLWEAKRNSLFKNS